MPHSTCLFSSNSQRVNNSVNTISDRLRNGLSCAFNNDTKLFKPVENKPQTPDTTETDEYPWCGPIFNGCSKQSMQTFFDNRNLTFYAISFLQKTLQAY